MTADKKIDFILKSQRVVVFMKGSPSFPQCGFSRKISQKILKHIPTFGHFNIFTDEDVSKRIRVRFNWKTFPMLFINQELVGGNDIVDEMIEDEEWEEFIKG